MNCKSSESRSLPSLRPSLMPRTSTFSVWWHRMPRWWLLAVTPSKSTSVTGLSTSPVMLATTRAPFELRSLSTKDIRLRYSRIFLIYLTMLYIIWYMT